MANQTVYAPASPGAYPVMMPSGTIFTTTAGGAAPGWCAIPQDANAQADFAAFVALNPPPINRQTGQPLPLSDYRFSQTIGPRLIGGLG